MQFNSIEFAIFLPVVFFLYWFVTNKSTKLQNGLLLLASYFFYGWWDWRFLLLIILSSSIDYLVSLKLEKSKKKNQRQLLLATSLLVNIGLLAFFKYYNFFIDNLVASFTVFGKELDPNRLNIILPVGISFYTFQTLSYTIDVYRKKIQATKDIVAFFTFVSFFPQLVAGPIERASDLLPQFSKQRRFNYDKAVDGTRQILWGLFKKVVIADNAAHFVNIIFDNYEVLNGSTLAIGAVLFSFQIYGDFSGYSDIAIGTARLFGFNLKQNFAFPYFSRDIAEFWRRWHISLTTWFRDYLYIPLGGSRGNLFSKIRNTFIIFIVSGLWHGASWNYIIWGVVNASLFLPLLLTKKHRTYLDVVGHGHRSVCFREIVQIALTFALTTLAWVIFRADDLPTAIQYISKIFSPSLLSIPRGFGFRDAIQLFVFIAIFISIEWKGREDKYAIQRFALNWNKNLRFIFYWFLIISIFLLSNNEHLFIYFQF